MPIIKINTLSEIKNRIGETQIGTDYESCTWLCIETKENSYYLMKTHQSHNSDDKHYYSVMKKTEREKSSAKKNWQEKEEIALDTLYWKIYDEILEDIGIK